MAESAGFSQALQRRLFAFNEMPQTEVLTGAFPSTYPAFIVQTDLNE